MASAVAPAPANSFRPVSTWQKVLGFRLLWPAVALVLLLVYNALCTPGFFDVRFLAGPDVDPSVSRSFITRLLHDRLFGSTIDILAVGTPVAILAIGMTLVIATGGVDLSVGSVMAISGVVAAALVTNAGHPWPFWAAAIVAILVSAAIGLWNGFLVSVLRIQPIIATLIMMVAGRGIAQKLGGGNKIPFTDPSFVSVGNDFFLGFPRGLTLVIFVFTIVAIATRRTALGLAIESVGDAPSASRYVGLRVKTIQMSAYVISAICAGIAGLVDASRTTAADPINSGLSKELDAIFAVVVGGTALAGGRFTLAGSILGALLLQTLGTTLLSTKLFGRDIRPAYLPLPQAIVIVVVCLLQSSKFRDAVLRPFRRRSSGRVG